MGYRISSLSRLPSISGINWYVFILGEHRWKDDFIEKVNENFNELAENIGPNAAIVSGHPNTNLCQELAHALEMASWNEHTIINKLVLSGQDQPAVLVLNSHPREVTKNSTVFYIPISEIYNSFQSVEIFFDKLCAALRNDTVPQFLKVFKKNEILKSIANNIDISIPLFGIVSFNLTNLVKDKLKNYK